MSVIVEGSPHLPNTIAPDFLGQGSGKIRLLGNNNEVSIGSRCSSQCVDITLVDGSRLTVGENCSLDEIIIYAARGATISIGVSTMFNGPARIFAHEKSHLSIGSACLFGRCLTIMSSDVHSIFEEHKRINPAKDVTVGDNVWIADNVTILKGVNVGGGSVIGACSLVTKDVPERSVVVGNPAKVIKSNVTWSR